MTPGSVKQGERVFNVFEDLKGVIRNPFFGWRVSVSLKERQELRMVIEPLIIFLGFNYHLNPPPLLLPGVSWEPSSTLSEGLTSNV